MVLVDTDVMIDVLREYPPAVAWLESLEEEEVVLPGLVAMEPVQGCGDKTEQRKLEAKLKPYRLAWPSSSACDAALNVFTAYYLSHGLGILGALIGQLAVSLGLPLHTFNQKHYESIPDLQIV